MGHRHWLLAKVVGAHASTRDSKHSSLLSQLHIHANPSHHCLGTVGIISSGIMRTSVSKQLAVTIWSDLLHFELAPIE